MTGSRSRLLVLVIIDGWGYSTDSFGNAIAAARKPTWDALWSRWPHGTLAAAGEPVGLPVGQQGNSEVGHLNLGAGRVVYQDLTRINLEISSGAFYRNPVLLEAIGSARPPKALHLLGLVSPGGVHSSSEHLYALLRMAKRAGITRVFVHAFTDGRDEPPTSAAGFVEQLQGQIREIGVGKIASISGRYYAMDRDRRWDRTEVAYRDEPLPDCLAQVFSDRGLHQFHTAETEKYAHVTYFLNGGREAAFPGEDRLLVPSPKVATYDQQPEMSARPVADVVLQKVAAGEHSFIVVNFANPDMVGHTGDFQATVRAVEVVDRELGRMEQAILGRGGLLAVTADHGNAELKIDRATGAPLTAHTTSPVPLILAGAEGVDRLRDGGKLGDVAPTVLSLVNLPVPSRMTGETLVPGLR